MFFSQQHHQSRFNLSKMLIVIWVSVGVLICTSFFYVTLYCDLLISYDVPFFSTVCI